MAGNVVIAATSSYEAFVSPTLMGCFPDKEEVVAFIIVSVAQQGGDKFVTFVTFCVFYRCDNLNLCASASGKNVYM